jgi:hypothetical protein
MFSRNLDREGREGVGRGVSEVKRIAVEALQFWFEHRGFVTV